MEIAFVILFILFSQLTQSVAIDQESGLNPYPLGTSVMCILMHLHLLILSIFYLGWIWGIVLFICHFFGIVRMTFSWILAIPSMFAKSTFQIIRIIRFRIGLLTPALVLSLIFAITSFIFAKYKSLYTLLTENTAWIRPVVILVAILSALRIVISIALSKRD